MKKLFKLLLLLIISLWFLNNRPNLAFGSYEDDINKEIKSLNDQINGNKNKMSDLQERQQKYRDLIMQKQSQSTTLNNQLDIINTGLDKTKLDIEAAQLEVDKTDLEIKKTTIDIQTKSDEIENQKNHIAAVLKILYREDQVSTLEILLLNNSFSDFLSQIKYLENTNTEIVDSVNDLKIAKDDLETNNKLLTDKQAELIKLKQALDDKKSGLESQQQDKSWLLDMTKQSERQYQDLLQKAKREEDQANAEIAKTEKLVREKLASIKDHPALKVTGFVWPVKKNTITTSFHDPEYPFRKTLGEHPGVDIRAAYGSTLKAASDGYVARVKFDGSKNYAYIMIIHANGISTVYGHVSAVSVKADEYVVQGQVIGKTGGLPGSPGSGPWTTGAHLHFEIRKDGIPVDPMDYLP